MGNRAEGAPQAPGSLLLCSHARGVCHAVRGLCGQMVASPV